VEIAILGTGSVGRALAGRLAGLGHGVTVGTRDPQATLARAAPGPMGAPPFRDWAAAHSAVRLATYAEAASGADLIVNATSGAATLAVLEAAGRDNLAGKVLLDISNALDTTRGFPPTLLMEGTDSLAERIQAAFPDARVVKSLNTLTAALMVEPGRLADGEHTVFVSGNDAEAKGVVSGLLKSFGHTDVIDLGDITTARGQEMWLALWLRLMTALQTPMFNLKIVR
jgi:predicted dinucleotide-binding enzyme